MERRPLIVTPAHRLRVLLPAAEIQRRIQEMGLEIASDYGDDPLQLVGVLKGSCIFLADLSRAIPRRVRFDFIGTSSYGAGRMSSGEVRLTKDLDVRIEDTDVLVVEDIVDTGVTLTYILKLLEQRKPRSLRVAALLDKPDRHQRDVRIDYLGFTIPNEFVVGYGLDFAEDYRTLADICVLADSE